MWNFLANATLATHILSIFLLVIAPLIAPHFAFVAVGFVVAAVAIGQMIANPFCPLTLLELRLRSKVDTVYWEHRNNFCALALAFAHEYGYISFHPNGKLIKRWKRIRTMIVATGIIISWSYAIMMKIQNAG